MSGRVSGGGGWVTVGGRNGEEGKREGLESRDEWEWGNGGLLPRRARIVSGMRSSFHRSTSYNHSPSLRAGPTRFFAQDRRAMAQPVRALTAGPEPAASSRRSRPTAAAPSARPNAWLRGKGGGAMGSNRTHALAHDERTGMIGCVGSISGRRESCWKALAGLERVEPIPDWASGRYSLYRHRNFDKSGCVGRRGVRHEGFTYRPQPAFSRAQDPLKRPQAAISPCPARTKGSAVR